MPGKKPKKVKIPKMSPPKPRVAATTKAVLQQVSNRQTSATKKKRKGVR